MILIVDDKPENLFSLKSILQLNGFEVDTADSGEEALKKVLKHNYALIILDVQMPVMDGFEVAEALSGFSKAKDIPIIFLSAANTEKRFITKGYLSGGIDYVTKPVDPDILLLKAKTFYRLFEQKRALMETQSALQAEIEVRKQAEDELDNKVQELRSVLESMPQIAFTLKSDGRIEFVNEPWHAYADSATRFPPLHPDDPDVYTAFQQAFRKGEPLMSEVRIKKIGTGEYRHHLLRIIPVKQADTILKWVGTFTNIHQQKLANEILEQKVEERTRELKETNEQLENRNHELQQFASVASHDLKEPLRKIQVFSTILRDKYMAGENNGALLYMDRIMHSSERMSGLINDLLSYSRLSVDTLFQVTDLNDIVAEITKDLELSILEKKARVHVSSLPVIDAIPGQMRQAFQNLLSNALKFSQKNRDPVINISAERIAQKDFNAGYDAKGCFCRIVVSDNGIGFNEKYLHKIFTIFQRLHTREAYEGTGIGLAITKKIVDKHNGMITAASEEDIGSRFIIILPLKQDQ